jgi:hypothetical protein
MAPSTGLVRQDRPDYEPHMTDRGALVVVANSGPVVPAGSVEDLFTPFRRGVRDRTNSHRGAGLGLAIVRAAVSAHGGELTAAARPEGGLQVAVVLPPATGV